MKDIKEVFAIALTDEKVADAIDLSVKKEKTEKKAPKTRRSRSKKAAPAAEAPAETAE